MLTYSVYLPSKEYRTTLAKVDDLVFINQSLPWLAVFSPLLWAVLNRLWVVAFVLIGILVLVNGMFSLLEIGIGAQLVIILLFNLLFALEAGRIWQWILEQKKGYHFEGFVTGDSETDCQRRFLEQWLLEKTSA